MPIEYTIPIPAVHRQEFNLYFSPRLYWALLQKSNNGEEVNIFNERIPLLKSNSHLAIYSEKEDKLRRLSKIHIAYNKKIDDKRNKLRKYFICDIYSNDKNVYYYTKDKNQKRKIGKKPGTYVNIVSVNMKKEEAIEQLYNIFNQLGLKSFITQYEKNKIYVSLNKEEFLKDLELYVRFPAKYKKNIESVLHEIENVCFNDELEKIKNETMYKLKVFDLSKFGIDTSGFKTEIKMYTLKNFNKFKNNNFLSSIKLEVSFNKKDEQVYYSQYDFILKKLREVIAFILYHANIEDFISDLYFNEFEKIKVNVNTTNFISMIKTIKQEEIKYYKENAADIQNKKSVLAILEQILLNEYCTIKYISQRTKLHYDTVRKLLKKLEEKDIIYSQHMGLGAVKSYLFKNNLVKQVIRTIVELEQEIIKMTIFPGLVEEEEDEFVKELKMNEAITEYIRNYKPRRRRKAKELIKVESNKKEVLKNYVREAEKIIENKKDDLDDINSIEIIIREVKYIDEEVDEINNENRRIDKIKAELEKMYSSKVRNYYNHIDFSKVKNVYDAESYLFTNKEISSTLRLLYEKRRGLEFG